MTTTNPFDANAALFNFANPPATAQSSFSLQYDPSIITAYSANPNANIAGGISPTQNSLSSLTPQDSNSSNSSSTSATSLVTPKLINYSPASTNSSSGTPTNSSGSAINSNASNLLSTAAQHSGVGKNVLGGVTDSINNFGTGLGFAGSSEAAGSYANAIAAGYSAADAGAISSTAAGVDAFGDSVVAGSAADVSGAAATDGLLGGATLSGTLGAAGLGFIGGGIIAHAIGGNQLGGSIGGAVGAAAGMAFGAAGAAALGLELGSFAGPIGAIVGGIGGALLGSVFGNSSPPTNATGAGAAINADGTLGTVGTESKNANATSTGFAGSAMANFGNLAQSAATSLGIQFSPDLQFNANYSSKHGGANIVVSNTKTGVSSGAISFNPTDAASSQQAYLQALQTAATYSGYTNTDQLNSWYNSNYVNGNSGATSTPPTIPNNPVAAQQQSDWQSFLSNYRTQQNANAAPS